MEVDWWQLQTSIITEVKKYPCLYDSNHISRWNARTRGPYWEAVAAAVNLRSVTDADCRRIWKGLRDNGPSCDAWTSSGITYGPRDRGGFPSMSKFTKSTGTASQGEEPDSVDYNEPTSTDVMAHVFACQDAAVEDVGAEGRWGSPVDFEIDVSPAPSDVANHSMDEGEAGAPSSAAPRPQPVSSRGATAKERLTLEAADQRVRTPEQRSAATWRRRHQEQHQGKEEEGQTDVGDDFERRTRDGAAAVGHRVAPVATAWTTSARATTATTLEVARQGQERREAAIEVALCRFVTTVVSKMASSSTPAGPVGEPASVKNEMIVDAGDGDTLFLLGLRGLMSKLDAESKSRAQIDILKLLQERIADAESRRPESCDEDDERAEQTADECAVNTDRPNTDRITLD
ncbi:hypothetical protein MTO96_048126 [Rhipicephalus appendiculatus]